MPMIQQEQASAIASNHKLEEMAQIELEPLPFEHKPKRSILIIDNNEDIRESLKLLLEILGHTIYLAASGIEGIKIARSVKPECVLCDIELPELDGYQIAEIFRSDPCLSSVYLIALSGYAKKTNKTIKSNFDVHLVKPPNFDLLEDILINLKVE
jgi:CheY-like chemotaxis protein